jgi:hypothetical protein
MGRAAVIQSISSCWPYGRRDLRTLSAAFFQRRFSAVQNIEALLKIWIIFPGFALSHLIPPYGFLNHFRGMPAWLPWTFPFLLLCIFSTWRFRHRVWLPLAGVVLTSSALVYVLLLLLRA